MWSLQFTHWVDCFERSKHGIDTVARAEYARRMNAGAYIREKMGSWTNPYSPLKEIRTIPLTSRPNKADLTGPGADLETVRVSAIEAGSQRLHTAIRS